MVVYWDIEEKKSSSFFEADGIVGKSESHPDVVVVVVGLLKFENGSVYCICPAPPRFIGDFAGV